MPHFATAEEELAHDYMAANALLRKLLTAIDEHVPTRFQMRGSQLYAAVAEVRAYLDEA